MPDWRVRCCQTSSPEPPGVRPWPLASVQPGLLFRGPLSWALLHVVWPPWVPLTAGPGPFRVKELSLWPREQSFIYLPCSAPCLSTFQHQVRPHRRGQRDGIRQGLRGVSAQCLAFLACVRPEGLWGLGWGPEGGPGSPGPHSVSSHQPRLLLPCMRVPPPPGASWGS